MVAAPATFPTKTDADQHLAKVEADQLRHQWTDPRLGRTGFPQWVTRWEQTTVNLRPKTQQLYGYLLRRFLLPAFGSAALVDIDSMAVRAWLASVQTETVSATTIAKAYRLLSRIMGEAVEGRYIARNPCTVKGAGVERPPEMRFATVEQVARLATAVGPRYRALVLVAALTGLRWGELAGLRVKRVDLLHSRITVAEQLTEVNGRFQFGPPKSEAGRRTVTVPRHAADALAEHLSRWAEAGPDGLVFPAPRGGPLRHSNFYRGVWLRATRVAGVEGLRFHDLRHTAATLALAAGANTRELMERMGHASPAAALRYQHVMAGRDAAIAAALDQLVQDVAKPAADRSGTHVARGARQRRRPAGE
jgi:integrase